MRHLIKGSRPQSGLNWLKLSEIFLEIGHLRLILKARCGKHGNYPSISQHLTDIHQLIVFDIQIDPYLASYNAQKSQIKPFSAQNGPKMTIFDHFYRNSTMKTSRTWSKCVRMLRSNCNTPISGLQKNFAFKNRAKMVKNGRKIK